MAEASPSIFNKKAAEKLRSPDDLDRYVRVTSPSAWAVVAEVAPVPLSRDEAHSELGSDYLVAALLDGDWGYLVTFEGDGADGLATGVPLTIDITTERVAPISLLFG